MSAVSPSRFVAGVVVTLTVATGCASDDSSTNVPDGDLDAALSDGSGSVADGSSEPADVLTPDAVPDGGDGGGDDPDARTDPDAGDPTDPDGDGSGERDVDGSGESDASDEDAADASDVSVSDDASDTAGSGDAGPTPGPDPLQAVRLFPTDENAGVQTPQCQLASPLAWERDGETELIIASGEFVRGLSPLTGEELWSVEVPTPFLEMGLLVSTPVIVGDLLVAAYAVNPRSDGPRGVGTRRVRHMAAVINLTERALDDAFEPVEIEGDFLANDGVTTIPFRPANALNRATLAHARAAGDELGRVFVTFGNVRDIQPWHGEAFELSLDAWRTGGADAAITGTLITTPEVDCGPAGASGSTSRICGGGLWSPGGHLVIQGDDSFELIMATGNGQLDVTRQDFSNSLLRVGPEMAFEPGCSPELCTDFDPDEPATACVESCQDAFIHRLPEGDETPGWGVGICEGLTMYQCWEELDYTGGSTPILATLQSGTEVIVSTGKDGGLYLVDRDRMGILHDRLQITEPCGTTTDRCIWTWAGTIVSTPVHVVIGGEDLILVPTFMPDATHSAGLVAAAIVEGGESMRLEPRWQLPEAGTAEATTRFRRHPSRLAVQTFGERNLAWVVETARPGGIGTLWGFDLDTAEVVVQQALAGPGYRFTQPLVLDDRIYLPSCASDDGPANLEGYQISNPVEE